MLLLSHSARNRNPNSFICKSSILSRFFSQSSQSFHVKPPPRKGRQAVRRILNLLSSKPHQNPNLLETLKILETSPQFLSSSQASTLITAISNPLISFDFYRFLKSSKPSFQPDSILFTSLIKSQIHSINPKGFKIEFYFNEMKKHKVSLSNDDLRSLFDLFVPNYVKIAEFFLKEVLEKNVYDEGSYNHVIKVYTKHGLCKDSILIAERAKARFENLSLGFYVCLMDVYRINGDARAAMKLFLEMEDKGVVADEEIYRLLLGILCRAGSVKLCLVVLEEMRRIGYRPDECVAMDLMKTFIKEDMLSEVRWLFKEGIFKGRECLSAFVEIMSENRRPLEGLELVKIVHGSGSAVDGRVYASLIRGCGNMGLIKEAENVFEEIKSFEGAENLELVYSSMIYVYSKRGMRTKAEMILNEMETKMESRESEEVFSCMISMYGELGLFNDVERIFNHWKKSGCNLNMDAYVVFLDALSKWGKMDQARGFMLEMRNFGIHPSSSIYSSMLEGYLRLGLINHAAALFDEYKLSGLEVDNLIPSSVISILSQAGRYTELGVYLDILVRQGVKIPRNKGHLVEICRSDSCLEKLGKLLQ